MPVYTLGYKGFDPAAVYCGRGSVLGNPFVLEGNTRANVIMGYRYYLWKMLQSFADKDSFQAALEVSEECPELNLHVAKTFRGFPASKMMGQLQNMALKAKEGELKLACYCYKTPAQFDPGAEYAWHCHTEVIAKAIAYIVAQAW